MFLANAPNSVTINPRVVRIPTPVDLLGSSGAPTGAVFNITTLPGSTPGFMISGVDANNNAEVGSGSLHLCNRGWDDCRLEPRRQPGRL